MTPEEKQLLLKDLCARLPYEVQCHIKHIHHLSGWIDEGDVILTGFRQNEFTKETELLFCNPVGNPKIVFPIDSVKPYLRPLSSITEKEKEEASEAIEIELNALQGPGGFTVENAASYTFMIDFYNKHHLDYRGLIEKGLALEAPKDMYV